MTDTAKSKLIANGLCLVCKSYVKYINTRTGRKHQLCYSCRELLREKSIYKRKVNKLNNTCHCGAALDGMDITVCNKCRVYNSKSKKQKRSLLVDNLRCECGGLLDPTDVNPVTKRYFVECEVCRKSRRDRRYYNKLKKVCQSCGKGPVTTLNMFTKKPHIVCRQCRSN